jgi:translation initiation factor 2 gamma subunit (eIF-2gamma)
VPYTNTKNATKKHNEDVDKYAKILKSADDAVSENAKGLKTSGEDKIKYDGLIKALKDKIGVKEVKAVAADPGKVPPVKEVKAVAATALQKTLGEKDAEIVTQESEIAYLQT